MADVTPLCFGCSRFAVDEDGDYCDLCLDDIAAELDGRLAQRER